MSSKSFAAGYNRDEQGRVLFPRDSQLRAQLFPYTEASEHVAKCNMIMIRELVEYVSEPNETILDPFAGTGTLLVAATIDRKVVMMELEDYFCGLIELNTIGIKQRGYDTDLLTTLIPGNSHNILPIPNFCDHAVFSPPYPMGLKKKGAMDKTSQDVGYTSATEYSSDPENFTNLNAFIYHQKIELFYKKCFQTLKLGGTMTVIIKDRIEQGKRVKQADRTERDCIRLGFTLVDRFKWYAPGGGYSGINRSKGLETVDEEDLIVLRKPNEQ